MKSSSGMPIIAAGRQPTMILPHRLQVSRHSWRVLPNPNGSRSRMNSTHTARIAPSWITTRNMFQNSSVTLSLMNSSTKIIWPVDEMGSHSVMPSTRPRKADLSSSMMSTWTSQTFERRRGERPMPSRKDEHRASRTGLLSPPTARCTEKACRSRHIAPADGSFGYNCGMAKQQDGPHGARRLS